MEEAFLTQPLPLPGPVSWQATRMAYDRMIQIVDITARLVGNALSIK
jgi:hypothetical protein